MIGGESVLLSNFSHIPYGRACCITAPKLALVVAVCDGNCPDVGVPKFGCLPVEEKAANCGACGCDCIDSKPVGLFSRVSDWSDFERCDSGVYFIGEACDDVGCDGSKLGALPYVFKFCVFELEDWSHFAPLSLHLAVTFEKFIGEMLNVIKSSANMSWLPGCGGCVPLV